MDVFLLHGGIVSTDGIITSAGMNILASKLRAIPGVTVHTYLWGNFAQCYKDIMASTDDQIVVIGYSGGGHKATWLANGFMGQYRAGKPYMHPEPKIDLMVLYDPSPTWSMMDIGPNVKKAINYHNTSPFMFGLGGGVLKGPNVTQIDIAEQHLAVQYDSALHNRTVGYVKELLNQKQK